MAEKAEKKKRGCLGSLLLLVLGAALGAACHIWYHCQDQAVKNKVQAAALDTVNFFREGRTTPREMRRLLDTVADWIPLNAGITVDAGGYNEENSFVYAGLPDGPGNLRLLKNKAYLAGFDEARKNPSWVAYRLTPHDAGEAPERPRGFREDPRLPGPARVFHADYTRSGYNRGHLAPNYGIAVCHGREAQKETFLMSNVVPQKPELNQKLWMELELRAADRFTPRFGEIWVVTGPVYYGNARPGRLPCGVVIPDAFYKIVFDEHERGLRALAFLIPHNVTGREKAGEFLTSINEIEARTGLDFCSALPDGVEEALESRANTRVW